jgi:MFS superfamily sulfate permease-like transporter
MGGYEAMILDMSDVTSIDFTSARAIEDIIDAANRGGCRFTYLCGAKGQVAVTLEKQRVLDLVDKEHLVESRAQALQQAAKKLEL